MDDQFLPVMFSKSAVIVPAVTFILLIHFAKMKLCRWRMKRQGRLLKWKAFVAYLAEEKGCVILSYCDGGRVWSYPDRELPKEPIPYLLSTEAYLVECPFWIRTRRQFEKAFPNIVVIESNEVAFE